MVDALNHGFIRFTNMPHILDPRCCLLVNQFKLTPQFMPLWGLNLANVYLTISWSLDSSGSMAFTIHLQSRLVLASSGTTRPRPSYFFLRQHYFQLTLVWVSCYLPNQRYLQMALLVFLRILLDPPCIVIKKPQG